MSRAPIVLPWKYCAQANHRLMPVARRTKTGKISIRLITAAGYREAKAGAEWHIKAQWKERPLSVPVELVARCYFPDKRKRDAGNLSKMIGDALTGIVLEDDSLIHRETWERSGIDKDNPRVEISIEPLSSGNSHSFRYEVTDEDYKRLFGKDWKKAKAKCEEIARAPFPEGYDFSAILEP